MQKLELLNKAVEMGASIDVKFHYVPSKETAIELMKMLRSDYKEDSFQGANWIESEENRLTVIIFHKGESK